MNDATQFFNTTAGGGDQIERSLRFNSADSAYLSRTPASAGNRKTWTWSGWVKRCRLSGSDDALFIASGGSGAANAGIDLSSDQIRVVDYNGSSVVWRVQTSAVLRDPSAWYHIVASVDTTQSTASDRVKIWINGAIQTAFANASYPSQNVDSYVNNTQVHYIGASISVSTASLYLADIHFIDGQALDPTSFAETNTTTGQWVPKAYTGTFTGNSFWLKFADNSAATATTLGKDSSGLGNNWTPNNLSVTAGAGNDSLTDTPTSFGTDTGAGGEVRGNYATLNPLTSSAVFTISNGSLDITDSGSSAPVVLGTIAVNSGKWYWEITLGNQYAYVGAAQVTSRSSVAYLGAITGQFMYNTNSPSSSFINGTIYNYSTASAATTGDVLGVALDFDSNTITFYKNGVSQGAFGSSVLGTSTWAPAFKSNLSTSAVFNFGQRPFAYTAPSGYKALCTTNLPEPTIADGSTAMDVVLDTGANILTAAQGAIGGSADLLWIKDRANSNNHQLIDTVRGGTATLQSNTTAAETTYSAPSGSSVAWAWDAGSSTVTNTDGSITSQVRANPSAGFSIVTYTGAAKSPSTVGHGLGVTPEFVIVKPRQSAVPWVCYKSGITTFGQYLLLNTTAAVTSSPASNYWGTSSDWTSTTFGIYPTGGSANNLVGQSHVAYCFAPVAGYSAFGSYTGNGSADGPFVYTGFRPRFILLKLSSGSANWLIIDSSRIGFNSYNYQLYPDLANAEGSGTGLIDILSNGFKLRQNNGAYNPSGGNVIYAAFAENPFQYARAR